MFLPSWYEKIKFLRVPPKIIGMFHQPPAYLDTLINIDIVKSLDQVQVVSPVQARYFEQFLPAERIKTILLGVDTQYFKPKLEPKRNKKFRCLGGGLWLRDYEALFKTAGILSDIPEIEFHIVAEKQDGYPDLENVLYYQSIPDEELFNLYQTCDILFLPMEDATANTFLMEGAACGLPVVSSDLESIRNYFPGEEAVLVKNNDPEVFASTILELKENSSKRKRMSESARKRAMDLSWEKIIKKYESLYIDLCFGKP
jgi:glycosyltransferase involved in cell wall biosynthesis